MKTKFEAGKKYGNDCTIEVLSRTEKTLTIKSCFGTQKIKVRYYDDSTEAILFKCWCITSDEVYDFEKAKEISMYNAYYR